MTPDIIRTKNFAKDAADFIAEKIQTAIARRGRCLFALSGGKTPLPVYSELAMHKEIDWRKVHVTFSDERCVSKYDEESNFRRAKESFLDNIYIPTGNIHRVRGEEPPEVAADLYEKMLNILKGEERDVRHDVLLLGIGDDGHTASLFPGTTALDEVERLVVANHVPKLDTWRVTFTYKLINNSHNICFLVNDKKKEGVLVEILSGDKKYPAANVSAHESLTWIIGG